MGDVRYAVQFWCKMFHAAISEFGAFSAVLGLVGSMVALLLTLHFGLAKPDEVLGNTF